MNTKQITGSIFLDLKKAFDMTRYSTNYYIMVYETKNTDGSLII